VRLGVILYPPFDRQNPQEAVVFASAAGASTCTRAGAIQGQPSLEQVERLAASSADWMGFW
jgi:fructokinase